MNIIGFINLLTLFDIARGDFRVQGASVLKVHHAHLNSFILAIKINIS